ncbi:MAG: Ger(x)C family spore germination protein [Sporomusaceae bacterium]|nr:Ger(x)C family spore germination protein [Sporomusaceae bacterium]
MKKCAIALLFISGLLCAGCYGSRETDELAYVLIVGVDKTETGKQKVTYQFAIPRKASGSRDGDSPEEPKQGKGEKPWTVSSIISPTSAEGRSLFNATLSRLPRLNHVTAYVFSEEVARDGIGPRITYNIRNPEFRETMFLIVVQGSAEEYIKTNDPSLAQTISKYYQIMFASAKESGYYLPANYHRFYARLKNNGGSPYATYSGINPMTGTNKPAAAKTPEQKGDPYLPQGVPRTGTENPAEFLGLAVFRGDKMVGVLNSDESRAVALLQGEFAYGYVGIADPLKPEKDTVNVLLRYDRKPDISASLHNNQAAFVIHLDIDAEILGISAETNYETAKLRPVLEKQLANLLQQQITRMLKHTQELGVDPVGLGLYLRPHFANTQAMERADLTALYRAAALDITVTANIRRTGLKWRNTFQ